MTDSHNTNDDDIDNLVIKRVAEMTDTEFGELIERTRPPQLEARDKAITAVRSFLGRND